MFCSKCNIAITPVVLKKVEQFVIYVLTTTFSPVIKIGFVLVFLLNRMLALKQIFRKKQDFLRKQDSSREQDSSNKQESSNEHDSWNKKYCSK